MPNFAPLQMERPRLAHCFAKHWATPLQEYAKLLYQPKENRIESLFLLALRFELQASGCDEEEIQQALDFLEQVPVLQCSHHVTPTFGPTFLTLDLISLSGLPPEAPYLIAANSGVAFSNSAWSGALSYQDLPLEELVEIETPLFKKALAASQERTEHGEEDSRLSLIPSKIRDQLVYAESVPESLFESLAQLRPELKALLATPVPEESYSSFANRCARKIEERLFGRKVIIFDFNRLIARYLVLLWDKSPNHPLLELLANPTLLDQINRSSAHPMQFLASHPGKKSKKIEKLLWTGQSLIGDKRGETPLDLTGLIQMLKAGELCPGILPCFLVARFTQGIRCLGSFNQIDYLERIRLDLAKLNLPWLDLTLHGPSLTTGRLKDFQAIWMPLDLALKGENIELAKFQHFPMSRFWEHYYLGLTR